MRRAWVAMVLAAWAGIADARGPIAEKERERIVALGKAGAAGDEAVLAGQVKARDRWGVEYWVRGYRGGLHGRDVEAPLPESLEALIVTHFADPAIGGRLVNIVRRGTYSSHRLFVLLNSLTRDRLSGRQPVRGYDGGAEFVVRTALPGVEDPLLRLVEKYCAFGPPTPMEPRNRGECSILEHFLAGRRHEPSRAWIAAQFAALPGRSLEFTGMLSALARFGDRASVDLIVGLAETAAAAPSAPEAEARAGEILWKLVEFDNAVPIDYGRLRRLMKAMPAGAVARSILAVVDKRNDPAGVALVVDAMGIDPTPMWFPDNAWNVIARMNSTAAWEAARDQLLGLKRAGPLKPAQEQGLARSYEGLRKVERDAEYRRRNEEADKRARAEAAVREATRQREAERVAPLAQARRLASQQPVEASGNYRRYIESLFGDARFKGNGGEVQAVRRELAEVADEAVRHDRFVRRDPRAAIEVLRLALRAPPPTDLRGPDERVGWHAQIGDILHFDLRDREAAAREFDAAAAVVRRDWKEDGLRDRAFIGGTLEWLAAESAFLRQGKTVRGAPSEGLRAALGWGAAFGSVPALREVERSLGKPGASRDAELRAKAHSILQALPPSRSNMEGLVRWLGAFPDEASLRAFVERHDPAGARTLVTLGGLLRVEQEGACDDRRTGEMIPWICDDRAKPHPAVEAARRILASRGVPAPAAADSRFSTPEGTWSAFIGALRAGDRSAALACMTPELRERFRGPLQSLDAARLRAMAGEFSPLELGQPMGIFQEAFVTRDRGGQKQAAMVYFLRQGREWRISEM